MPFDSNAFLNNPWTQMGLGILGANQPGIGTAAAIGGGASAGLNNLMRLQLMKEDATLRKTKAEMLKEESARAKAQAQQDAEIRRVQNERLAQMYPELVGASEEEKKQFFQSQYDRPSSYQEWVLAGQPGTYENWVKSTTPGSPTFNIGSGDKYIESREKADAEMVTEFRKQADASFNALGKIDRFITNAEKGTAGGAQPVITWMQNLLGSLGFSDEELVSTQTMAQAVAGLKADYMKQLGARGLTDQDMKILGEALPKVASDPVARLEVAKILRKEHEAAIQEYINIVDQENVDYPGNRFKRPHWLKAYRKRMETPEGDGSQYDSLW